MLPFSIISAFIDDGLNFLGNNAAVIKLDKEFNGQEMQKIARDLNQPATTFIWEKEKGLFVRWFAPDAEINLCGHGSLAAFHYLGTSTKTVLHFPDGKISGWRNNDNSTSMKLIAIPSQNGGIPDEFIRKGIAAEVYGYFTNNNKNIVLLENEAAVSNANPDFAILKNMDPFGIILTAPGNEVDFVSRTIVPKVQQLEDHATGSSHAALAPFWAKRLRKNHLTAHQLSPRGGKFICKMEDNHVILTGNARVIADGRVR